MSTASNQLSGQHKTGMKICTCHQKCGGQKLVSLRTYDRHRTFRQLDRNDPGWWSRPGQSAPSANDEQDFEDEQDDAPTPSASARDPPQRDNAQTGATGLDGFFPAQGMHDEVSMRLDCLLAWLCSHNAHSTGFCVVCSTNTETRVVWAPTTTTS
jgi:hypothetical protein